MALTAYDYPTARILDPVGLDFLLVGDSLGMVVLGLPDTTGVTLADMVHHLKAVRRGASQTPVIVDLPIGTYTDPEVALQTAMVLRDAGADGVKLEGGEEVIAQTRLLTDSGFLVIGHIGMLPQRVRVEGGYHIKGRSPAEADHLTRDALALESAGVAGIVLELVSPPLAREISGKLKIPTIGIGSGDGCDGQILVIHDLIGLFPWFRPSFAQARVEIAPLIADAAKAFMRDIPGGLP